MENQENKARFMALVSKETSTWEQEALQRQAESGWRIKSAAIALQILRRLRIQKLSQKQLAELVGVTPQYINKIVKGAENLSLETITKLEAALGKSLITIYVDELSSLGVGTSTQRISVDYYRGGATQPERVTDRYARFHINSGHFSA